MTRPATRAGSPFCMHMAEAVHKTGNVVLVDTYAQKTALRLGVSPEAVRAEFKKVPTTQTAPMADEDESFESAESTEAPRPSNHEFHLLKLLLLHDNLAAWAALHLDVNWISHPVVRQIVGQRLAAQTDESWKSLAAFLDACDSAEMRNLVTEAVAEDRKIPNPDQQLADVALKLRNQFLDRQIAALTQKASQPEIPEAEQTELLREREKLRGQKRAPLRRWNVVAQASRLRVQIRQAKCRAARKRRNPFGLRLFSSAKNYFAPWSIHARMRPIWSAVSGLMWPCCSAAASRTSGRRSNARRPSRR